MLFQWDGQQIWLGVGVRMVMSMRLFGSVLVAYVAGAVLSAQFFGASTVAAFFPAAGVGVSVMLLSPRSRWPAVVAAIVLGELLVDFSHGVSWGMAAGFALADVIEPLVGASVVRAWCGGGTPDLRRTRDLSIFVAGACVLGPAVGGLVNGVFNFLLVGTPWMASALQWLVADGISILVVGGSILLWPRQSHILKKRPIETAVVLLAAIVLSNIGFRAQMPPAILVMPLLAWAAVRLNMLGTALTGSVIAFVGNYANLLHQGAISEMEASDFEKLTATQAFIAVTVLTALIIAQEVSRRRRAVEERDTEHGERLRIESLSLLAQQLSVALTPHDVAEVIGHQLLDDIGAKSFGIASRSDGGSRLEWIVTTGNLSLLGERGIATDAMTTRQPVLIRTMDEYEKRYGSVPERIRDGNVESLAGLPMLSKDVAIGVLVLAWSEPQHFDSEQLAYISAAASIAGQALMRAQFYADEHARAVVLHAALHPTGSIGPDGLDYGVCYEPADIVHGLGGDWYDIMQLPNGRTYFAVGDIVGHGLPAVEDMSQLRTAGRAFAYRSQSASALLTDLNGFAASVTRGEFATMMVAIFDHETALLSYCSAGHPPALLRRGDGGGVVRLADANGPALGLQADVAYDEGVTRIHPGDVLVLYTDGLVEHAGSTIWDGISRVEQLLAESPPTALLDCKSVVRKLAPPPRSDDTCLVAVRFAGAMLN